MKWILALAAVTAVLAGCGKAATGTTAAGERHSWTRPGELRIAIQGEPKNLNPLLTSNTIDVFIARFMFDPLIAPDAKGVQQPMLAQTVPTTQNGDISKDGLTIVYRMRKNVKWSDGQPVTSKDVKWSWQAIMNPDNNIISRHAYDDVAAIDTPDAYTVVVHLKQRFAPFVNSFFTDSDQPYSVAPEHALSKYPNINQVEFNSRPTVTDGAFRFAKWVHNDRISLVANPDYYLGKPGLKSIEIKIVPDENTSVNLLKTHAVDWIYQASIRTYPDLRDAPGITTKWVEVNGYYTFQMNTSHAPLSDVRVRRAIAYAIDKQNLVKTAMYGQEKVATEDLPDWMWAYDPSVRSIPYDPAMSKSLLAQAGYSPGAGEILQKNGQPLSLLMVTVNSDVTYRQLAVQIQEQLRRVGIDMQIKEFPGAQLFAPAGEGGVLQLGTFDIVFDGWFAGIDPDDSSLFMCKNVPPGGYNYSRYCNPEMDAAEKMALANYDQPARKRAYAKTQALLARDVPQIFISWQHQSHPMNVDFKGFSPNPVIENWNSWQWSI
ncbi:MAG: peptide ABC transporter substrate-binding protein [Candidatus Baltobacteraceae bacterium]